MQQQKTRSSQHSQKCKDPRRQCFCDSWPWPFDPKMNEFPELIMNNFYVEFGDRSCTGFWDIMRKDRQTNGDENPTPVTAIGVDNYASSTNCTSTCSAQIGMVWDGMPYRHLPGRVKIIPSLPPWEISVQRPQSTSSSSVVTLVQPPTSSSPKLIDRSFCYASPCLCNQLPLSLCQPHSGTNSSISTHLFLHPSLLPLLIHHSAHP